VLRVSGAATVSERDQGAAGPEAAGDRAGRRGDRRRIDAGCAQPLEIVAEHLSVPFGH
jgi:hypothetical protein